EHALSYMLQTMATIPVYWLIVQSSTEYDLDRILKAFIIAAALNSLAFMVFFLYGTPQAALAGFIFGFLRPMVLGVNANLWPYPSLIAIPILIAYFVHKPLTWRDQMWFGAALVVVSAIVVINMSRSVILGLFGATLFILWTHADWRRRLLIGSVVLGIIAMVTLPLYYDILEGVLRLKSGLTGREQLWRMSFMAIMHDPLFGLGPANLQERFVLISPFMRNGAVINADMPSTHNLYLQVAVEIGVLGALISLSIMLLFFYRSWKLWSQLKGTLLFPALVALTGVVFAAFIRSIFETELAFQHGHLYKNLFVLISLAFQDQLSHRAARDYGR
ncbi:O-antigen ligase family protein, partial [bacterium]|nr:O-antigen ligase family protein [bacterium]